MPRLKAAWYRLFDFPPRLVPAFFVYNLSSPAYRERCRRDLCRNELTSRRAALVKLYASHLYYRLDDDRRLALNHDVFWGGAQGAPDWHERCLDSHPYREGLLARRAPVVDRMERIAADYERLVELGAGNGVFLEHLAERLPSLTRLVGQELNPAVATRTAARLAGEPRISIRTGTAEEVVRGLEDAPTMFFAGRTLDYLSRAELLRLLQTIAARFRRATFGLQEQSYVGWPGLPLVRRLPWHGGHGGLCYSHDYARAFRAAGWRVLWRSVGPIEPLGTGFYGVRLLAVSER